MKSIGQKIKSITGLLGTNAINEWESQFIQSIKERTNDGDRTRYLSSAQAEKIEQIHAKHFGAG